VLVQAFDRIDRRLAEGFGRGRDHGVELGDALPRGRERRLSFAREQQDD